MPTRRTAGRLVLILGDQLDHSAPVLASVTPRDTVVMIEAAAESRHVPSHVQRTVLFLSAMRHFADELRARGTRTRYFRLGEVASLEEGLRTAIKETAAREVALTHPGEWRVLQALESIGLPLAVLPDTHFVCDTAEFERWARGRSLLTMEHFYRHQRRRTGYLMLEDKPEGGRWNFDAENRESFGDAAPRAPHPLRFEPDAITRSVIDDVRAQLPELPGKIDSFAWPVTRRQALEALDDFVRHRLPGFGRWQDAMWTGERVLFHSLLSPALNLKLISPRECCEAAIEQYRAGRAPIESVEGFVRQIIGWREFIRGVYWLEGPEYANRNGLDSRGSLPEMYWTGETDMACMRECIGQVLEHGYGHHIQRLMVTGNFALISGVHPRAISDWYLGMYVDAVDWVTLPNTLGMVMHADRRPRAPRGTTGLVGTKPYAASGKYIQRMSNYCESCRFDPAVRTGSNACPFNTFYWDFLLRHRQRLEGNQRVAMMLKNADRLKEPERVQITTDAAILRRRLGIDK